MAGFQVREEVLNVVLGQLLEDRGFVSVPETVRQAAEGRRMPDVTIADMFGLSIVIEGRIDSRNASDTLLADAKKRIVEGTSRMVLAVLYPSRLSRGVTTMPQLRSAMGRATLSVRVLTEGSDGEWSESNVDGIGEILRRGYELLIREDVVLRAVEELSAAIDEAAFNIAGTASAPSRVRRVLGIPADNDGPDEED